MALPSLKLELTNNISGLSETGPLVYCYNSFYNLQNPSPSETQTLRGLNITKDNAEIEIDKPIQLETEVCYDDSVNLIITDRKNPPKIVNSRFYQTDSLHYKIADRKGNLDTNIYSEENFKIETSLIKKVRTITSLSFLGIADSGKMPVGNYTFYFKLADADGNETDFISESGKVVCHMGAVNNPESIRGGLLDEDSNKLIKFKLHNLDLAYDYINIYYTRSTGDPSQEVVRAYKIDSKFKITNNDTEIAITGYENHIEIGIDEINVQYASFNAVDSLANCQNISFAGNITNDYEVFKSLEELSLRITPQLVYDEEGIGNLSNNYSEQHGNIGGEYYNVNNIYYKLGYWDEEIYRFGIVYILNDYTLSPVFNIRGKKTIDLNTEFEHFDVSKPINSREDYIIENSDSYSNNPEIVKILLNAGADLNKQDIDGNTALIHAVYFNSIEVATLLLEAGVDIDKQDNYGNTALMSAASSNRRENVELLLNYGADEFILNDNNESFYDYLTYKNKQYFLHKYPTSVYKQFITIIKNLLLNLLKIII